MMILFGQFQIEAHTYKEIYKRFYKTNYQERNAQNTSSRYVELYYFCIYLAGTHWIYRDGRASKKCTLFGNGRRVDGGLTGLV